ncbi:MAG TPA: nucleoside phosphorylase [Trebonia sp.]|nr:nucleoside phosphorylase [Trebonia sp.]
MTRRAADAWLDGMPPHIPARAGTLPPVCLLPGDPGRVDLAAQVLADYRVLGSRREFKIATGSFAGRGMAVCSTGIGGPSTEIAIVELSRLGVSTFIRVGGMGATRASIPPGSLTVVTQVARGGGAARFYAPDAAEIPADQEVTDALREAAIRRGAPAHEIRVLSCDSYYLGEGRPVAGLEELAASRAADIDAMGVAAMDMECETVFAVARALRRRYGAILTAHGNRVTDEWLEDYEPAQLLMLQVACAAGAALAVPTSPEASSLSADAPAPAQAVLPPGDQSGALSSGEAATGQRPGVQAEPAVRKP